MGLVVGLLRGVKKCEERVSVREKEKRERERDIDRTNARRTHQHHPLTRCVLQREGEKRHRTLKTHSVLLNPTSKANPFADRKNKVVVVETNDNTATKTLPRRTKNMTNERTNERTTIGLLTTSRCFFPQVKRKGDSIRHKGKRKKKKKVPPATRTRCCCQYYEYYDDQRNKRSNLRGHPPSPRHLALLREMRWNLRVRSNWTNDFRAQDKKKSIWESN